MTLTHGIEVPSRSAYLIRDDHNTLLKYVDTVRDSGENINVLVKGPQGCGKSSMPNQYAATRELPLATLEVGLLSEAAQIFGTVRLQDGETFYAPGLFTQAISTPNCVIHLQELNRPESDKTLNAIFSVLDDQQRKIWIDEANRFVSVAEGVTFFATLNEGYEFIGTMPVDEALEDRFPVKMRLDYLPARQEIDLIIMRCRLQEPQAREIATVAGELRNNAQTPVHVSTRNVLAIGNLMKFGMSLADAIRATIALDTDKVETALASMHFSGAELESNIDYMDYKLLS